MVDVGKSPFCQKKCMNPLSNTNNSEVMWRNDHSHIFTVDEELFSSFR